MAAKAEAYLKQTGIADTSYWGPEAEFFIFNDVRYGGGTNIAIYHIDSDEGWWNSGTDLRPNFGGQIPPKRGYFPVPPTDTLQDVRSKIVMALEERRRADRDAPSRGRHRRPDRDRHALRHADPHGRQRA